jgi:endoglucanase
MKTKIFLLSLIYFFSILIPLIIEGQSWIRINQLGYLPVSVKVGVLVSQEQISPVGFELHHALTGRVLYQSGNIKDCGPYGPFKSSFRLDFSDYVQEGAVYLEAAGARSPVFNISTEVYDGSADFLLHYMRQQRCGYNPFLHDSCHTRDGYIIYQSGSDSAHIDVTGGWHDATDYLQYTATSANAVYQMLLAYWQNPGAFGDSYLANGEAGVNGIPDIIDEVKWGIDWLIKMNPDSGQMYNQIADDRDHKGFRLPNEDSVSYGKGLERPVYFCTGQVQGIYQYKNRATGIASTAGKFSSAFALGALVMNDFDTVLSNRLRQKAIEAWKFGRTNPGACQTAPCTAPYFYEEDNWTDDMELAGISLFELTGDRQYLLEAVAFGRQEQVTPWMGADTARHYQWYPFLNMGHWGIGKSPDEEFTREFAGYWRKGIDTVWKKGMDSPFLNGVPGIWCSNNLTVALLTQCHLYASLTGDRTYDEMEAALRDWLFGCNPWGTSMVIGLPAYGDYPADPHSSLSVLHGYRLDGGLVDGPVYNSIFTNLKGISIAGGDEYQAFQSNLTVYHDDYADYSTNEPTMDGTADLTYYLSALQQEATNGMKPDRQNEYSFGGLIRGNKSKKQISLVFTGHDRADGLKVVRRTLHDHGIKASFFLTGDFYRNNDFSGKIRSLLKEGHYLGAHSDKHLLYCAWDNRDSLLVTKSRFIADLRNNYAAMSRYNINADRARYFLPPFEWYNDSIAAWCNQYGLRLVNFSPGSSSNQDWTYPELGEQYVSSETIYEKILQLEKNSPDGLNGFILLTHFGTDPRRPDKLYDRLDDLITELEGRGYRFVTLEELR